MVDYVNIGLRTLMCLAFLIWVVRPMMMALLHREPRVNDLEEMAETAVHNAFNAWRLQQGRKYYDNPEHALLALEHPELLNLPPDAPAVEEPKLEEETVAVTPEVDAQDASPAEPEVATSAAEEVSAESAVPQTEGTPQDTLAVAETASGEQGEDEDESLEQMRDRIKREQKKKKPMIPTELLDSANSYEDKLMVLRMIVDQDKDRVAGALRRMVSTN